MAIKTMTMRTWHEKLQRDDPSNPQVNGYSPGGAADVLGMTRQAVMYHINQGNLDAIRVPVPVGRGCYWLITQDAISAFQSRKAG